MGRLDMLSRAWSESTLDETQVESRSGRLVQYGRAAWVVPGFFVRSRPWAGLQYRVRFAVRLRQ